MPKLKTLKPRLATLPTKFATIQSGGWRTDKESSTKRGYGYKWQQARAEYLAEQPYCVYCAREAGIEGEPLSPEFLSQCIRRGVGLANIVDHIEAHRGNTELFWKRSNWQSMCTPHHSRDKQREEAQGW